MTLNESKPKIINTLDHVVANLQAEASVAEVEVARRTVAHPLDESVRATTEKLATTLLG